MKKWVYLNYRLWGISLFILNSASAQKVSLDTGALQPALNQANAFYLKAIDEQLPLYNGLAYYVYNPVEIKGSANFMETALTPGSVFYDGVRYKGVRLSYDLYKDQLISLLPDQYSMFVLINFSVQNFDLPDHHFINIDADTLAKNTVIRTGYYEELYHGRTEVLSKRYKTIQSYQSSTGDLEAYNYFTVAKEDFFVRKDNVYYKVDSQGALVAVLRDRKKQLRQFIKAARIKFSKEPGKALAGIAAYYDRITN